MTRPKDKPPTEGGRAKELSEEFEAVIDTEETQAVKLAKMSLFFIKKIAKLEIENWHLKQKLEEISED